MSESCGQAPATAAAVCAIDRDANSLTRCSWLHWHCPALAHFGSAPALAIAAAAQLGNLNNHQHHHRDIEWFPGRVRSRRPLRPGVKNEPAAAAVMIQAQYRRLRQATSTISAGIVVTVLGHRQGRRVGWPHSQFKLNHDAIMITKGPATGTV